MNSGRYILSQVLDLVDRKMLFRLVERYNAESRVRHFGCRQQLICMAFAQLTWREGLRDIATCLNARNETLYHLGFREPVAKSTLADANDQRDWRLCGGAQDLHYDGRNLHGLKARVEQGDLQFDALAQEIRPGLIRGAEAFAHELARNRVVKLDPPGLPS